MSLTPEQMSDLRQRVLQGKQLSLEEARAVFDQLRGNRLTAAEAASKPKQKRKKGMSDDELLSDLDNYLPGNTSEPVTPGGDGAPDLNIS